MPPFSCTVLYFCNGSIKLQPVKLNSSTSRNLAAQHSIRVTLGCIMSTDTYWSLSIAHDTQESFMFVNIHFTVRRSFQISLPSDIHNTGGDSQVTSCFQSTYSLVCRQYSLESKHMALLSNNQLYIQNMSL